MKILSIALCVVFCIGFSQHSFAERTKKLTEKNVKTFVHEATNMTSGQGDVKMDEIVDFLEKHLDKKARFKSTVTYILPGFPPQESALALDKDTYIQNIVEGYDALDKHNSTIEVKSIQLSSNAKQAIVQTEGKETGTMAIPVPDGVSQDVPIEGFTKCNQIIRLGKKGVIQMYNAVCDTRIEFTGGF